MICSYFKWLIKVNYRNRQSVFMPQVHAVPVGLISAAHITLYNPGDELCIEIWNRDDGVCRDLQDNNDDTCNAFVLVK